MSVADVLAEVLEDLADLLELDPGVEELLDRLQLEEVVVGVAAAAPAARRVAQRRPDQVGACPVVELAVRDADDLCRAGAAVADLGLVDAPAAAGRRVVRSSDPRVSPVRPAQHHERVEIAALLT